MNANPGKLHFLSYISKGNLGFVLDLVGRCKVLNEAVLNIYRNTFHFKSSNGINFSDFKTEINFYHDMADLQIINSRELMACPLVVAHWPKVQDDITQS